MRFRVRGLYFKRVDRHMLRVWKRRGEKDYCRSLELSDPLPRVVSWPDLSLCTHNRSIIVIASRVLTSPVFQQVELIKAACGRPPLSFTSLMCASNELLGNTTNYFTSVFIWSTWNYPFCHWQNALPAVGSSDSSQQHVWHSLTTKQQENQ